MQRGFLGRVPPRAAPLRLARLARGDGRYALLNSLTKTDLLILDIGGRRSSTTNNAAIFWK
ncbi:hypothetical protein [Mesorhizobium sp. M0968]|uniref:hypothetical protein n=1 Tax=Mesorhizobium sp. M0968 TaxID=2957037 RepID=UPI003339F90D